MAEAMLRISERAKGATGTRLGVATGASIVFAGTLLPWHDGRSGFAAVERLLALSEIAGIREAVPPRWSLVCWYAIPVAACALWIASPFGSRWVLVALAAATTVAATVVGAAVWRSDQGELIGPAVAAAGAGLALLAATLVRPEHTIVNETERSRTR